MKNNSTESPPSLGFYSTKINFKVLYQKFKFKVIRHFALTILRVILGNIIFGAIIELFRTERLPSDYAKLIIPEPLRKFS